MDIQQPKFCHSMNKGINSLYFGGIQTDTAWGYAFFSKHSKIKQKNVVYDDSVFPMATGERIQIDKFKGSSAAIEVVYKLDEVFKRENYKNQKAYQNRIKTPLSIIKKLSITCSRATVEELREIETLHDEWVEKKLADPRTHKITFSKRRYINCVINGFNRTDSFVYVLKNAESKIVGCRVVCKAEDVLFDAANFIAFWSYNQLSEACNVVSLQQIMQDHPECSWFNTGMATGTLKKYKQHFPNVELRVYRSNVKQEVIEIDV